MFLPIFLDDLDTPDPKIAKNHEKWPKMAVLAIFDDFFGQQGPKYTNFSLLILN